MAWDAEFIDGFDKYGPIGYTGFPANTIGEWTNSAGLPTLVSSLSGLSGTAVSISGSIGLLSKTLTNNYARCLGGCRIKANPLGSLAGVQFQDTGTAQLSIGFNASGQVVVYRGSFSGTLLATSTQVISVNTVHYLEWDVTFSNGSGIVNVYLDGAPTSISITSQNTIITTHSYFNTFTFTTPGNGTTMVYDDLYCRLFLSSGSADVCLNTNPIIETSTATSDSQAQFTPITGVLGQAYSTTATTSSPGANELALRQFTPGVNVTINSIGILPQTTSGPVNFKGVIYTNSAGVAQTLLSSGTQVTGSTAGTSLTLPLVTPQTLIAGTPYWIGYITDTSINLTQVDTTTNSSKAANTYASGAPGTAPAMTTGQPSWQIWGTVTSMATNYTQIDTNPPLGDLSYNQANVVNKEDLYNFTPLATNTTNIATVAVKSYNRIGTPGVRAVTLNTKSGSTDSSGSAGNLIPASSYNWMGSYFDVDPNGSATWTITGVNSATSGIKVTG